MRKAGEAKTKGRRDKRGVAEGADGSMAETCTVSHGKQLQKQTFADKPMK